MPSSSGAVQSGVEALLDDGGPDVVAARVVAVVDGEDRPASGRRRPPAATAPGTRGRSRGSAADSPRLTSATDVAVRALEEHRRAIALEQDHRVVDQAGQDPVEVEPAADVAGHPAQGLRAVEQVRHLLGALGAADDRARARRPPTRAISTSRLPERPAASRRRRAGRPTARAVPGIATASSGRPSGRTARAARPASRRAARRASASDRIDRDRPPARAPGRRSRTTTGRSARRVGSQLVGVAPGHGRTSCPAAASQTATR